MRAVLIIILFFYPSAGILAQHKFPGPCMIIEGNFKIDSLVPAGGALARFPVKIPSEDTLTGTSVQFKSSIASVAVSETQLILRNKIIVQYQVNTYDQINTSNLVSVCTRYFGESVKSLKGVKSAMYFWKHQVSGKEIHTVLITARGGKKGELISWMVKL